MTEFRLGGPVVTGDLRIIPIEAVRCDRYPTKRGFFVLAFKSPAYVVVATQSEIRAFDMEGAEVSLADIACKLPEPLTVGTL